MLLGFFQGGAWRGDWCRAVRVKNQMIKLHSQVIVLCWTMTRSKLSHITQSLNPLLIKKKKLISFNLIKKTEYLEMSSSSAPFRCLVLKPLAAFPSVRRPDVPPPASRGLQQKKTSTALLIMHSTWIKYPTLYRSMLSLPSRNTLEINAKSSWNVSFYFAKERPWKLHFACFLKKEQQSKLTWPLLYVYVSPWSMITAINPKQDCFPLIP